MSQEEIDTVMLDDLGPDIDFLDDLLSGEHAIDWCGLEPSLSYVPSSPSSPLGPEISYTSLVSNLHSDSSNSPPPPQPPLTFTLPPPTPSNTLKLPPLRAKASAQPQLLPSPLMSLDQSNAQLQSFTTPNGQFAGFGIPLSSSVFGNTVLLPQIQLAVLETPNNNGLNISNGANISSGGNNNKEKILMKRIEKKERKREGTNRRSSHNAIERRYRSSINDKILELKNLVCSPSDPNEKVHKAAILRSSIDTIRHLQSVNSRLDKENRELKKSMSKCVRCSTDMSLRALLTSAPMSPPPTEGESTDSSNPPSPNEDTNSKKSLLSKSPLVLFSIVTCLFLVNPIRNNIKENETSSPTTHPHSRVERSLVSKLGRFTNVDFEYYSDLGSSWYYPQLMTILINLCIFVFLYYLTSKIGLFRRRRSKDSKHDKLETLKFIKQSPKSKREEIEEILSKIDSLPQNKLALFINILKNLLLLPFAFKKRRDGEVDSKGTELNEEISKLFLEYGKCGGSLLFSSLRAMIYSPHNKETLIKSLFQAKSKGLLKFVLLWTDFGGHPTFGTAEGLIFLKNSIRKTLSSDCMLSSCATSGDELSLLESKFREETLFIGIYELFHYGGGTELFKTVLKSAGKSDKGASFWAALFWVESEWIHKGGRPEVLNRLYKLIDYIWTNMDHPNDKESNTLLSAVYKLHLCKRAIVSGGMPSKLILNEASQNLRDNINVASDKPKRVVQLIWSLAAEWILECRLELWEETKCIEGFSSDLDTLRSLSHYIPTILPSVYLYEASQRLMNSAAPSRTQHLLDASLRQIRSSQRVLICSSYSDDLAALNSSTKRREGTNCKIGKKGEVNLVREKRKAMALYLKCKYLPNQVITCPGEKAGMLREALKALDKIGGRKKITECLEMIRSLGQNITLH